jgi:hypothetical protein
VTSKTRALFQRIVRIPPYPYDDSDPIHTSYEAYAPVSVYRALVMRSNLQFMLDEMAQVRMNFVTPNSGEGPDAFYVGNGTANTVRFVWSMDFEHTWWRPDLPMALDVAFEATVGSTDVSDLTCDVRIVPARSPKDDLSVPAMLTLTATTTGAGTTCVAAGLMQPTRGDPSLDRARIFTPFSVQEDGFYRVPSVALMRAEVALTVPANDSGIIKSGYIREFPWL